MCGIAGVVDNSGLDIRGLMAMSSSIRHRGPDDEGFALQEKGTMIYCRGKDTIPELKGLAHIANQEACQAEIGFVHRRLSILDLRIIVNVQ